MRAQQIIVCPCSHHAAVSIHYGCASINCIPAFSPKVRPLYAQIALGENASTNISFYDNLHSNISSYEDPDMFHADFKSLSFDLIRAGARDNDVDADISELQTEDYRHRVRNACSQRFEGNITGSN